MPKSRPWSIDGPRITRSIYSYWFSYVKRHHTTPILSITFHFFCWSFLLISIGKKSSRKTKQKEAKPTHTKIYLYSICDIQYILFSIIFLFSLRRKESCSYFALLTTHFIVFSGNAEPKERKKNRKKKTLWQSQKKERKETRKHIQNSYSFLHLIIFMTSYLPFFSFCCIHNLTFDTTTERVGRNPLHLFKQSLTIFHSFLSHVFFSFTFPFFSFYYSFAVNQIQR